MLRALVHWVATAGSRFKRNQRVGVVRMIFVGVDWAEAHHDAFVLDGEGKVLGRKRVADSLGSVRELHALVASHLGDDDVNHEVVVGSEREKGSGASSSARPSSLPFRGDHRRLARRLDASLRSIAKPRGPYSNGPRSVH